LTQPLLKAGCPAFLFVVSCWCEAALLFWPVEAIMVGFFTVREFMANGLGSSGSHLTATEFHNLKGIPQEKWYLFIQWKTRKFAYILYR